MTLTPLQTACERAQELDAKATPGPWRKCSAHDGKCQCKSIWSVPADAPVLEVNQKWGAPYATLRGVDGDGLGSIGAKVEAVIEMIEYGEIPEEQMQSNKDLIAFSRTFTPAAAKALKIMAEALNEARCDADDDLIHYSIGRPTEDAIQRRLAKLTAALTAATEHFKV